ncbi:DUF2325 domain-containing protein [Clostridium malenominatum]
MSVVIIGGHDRMACTYKDICKQHSCKAKVFTQMPANFKKMIGNPDLLVLFTNTVSHNMVLNAVKIGEKTGAKIVRSHSSSSCALKGILADHCSEINCMDCPNYNYCK